MFSWFITQGFSVQGWHCWSWHNPNAFQLYALCCSYLPTVASSLTSLSVDKYSTHGAYELVWTSCMYVHVKSPIHHDTSLFPLLKCQRCGMPHFFGEKKWVPNSAGCARNCARPWVWSASLRELWVPLRPPGAPCPVLGPLASSRIGSIHLGGRLVSGNGCGSKLATKKWRLGMTSIRHK